METANGAKQSLYGNTDYQWIIWTSWNSKLAIKKKHFKKAKRHQYNNDFKKSYVSQMVH